MRCLPVTLAFVLLPAAIADEPKAFIDGTGPGWRAFVEDDFEAVNCPVETYRWKDGTIHVSGTPVGVLRTKKSLTNLELVAQWKHLKPAGNSGIFLWASEAGMKGLKPNQLPSVGIEVQVLDLEYTAMVAKGGGKTDWFTCHGDVFPVAGSTMKPFAPMAPDKRRSFPRKNLTKPHGEWNHYYVRAINGEVRLWVNGEEVSGGSDCSPRTGRLCLESEGSPIEFKGLRIRELP